MAELNPRQLRFCEEYLLDLNASAAARRAGYSAKTADVQGARLLGNVRVAARVAELKQERSEQTGIDAQWVLERLVEVVERCMSNVTPAVGRDGKRLHDPDTGTPLYKFDAAGASRALELAGKHIGVNAFQERVSVDHGSELMERILAARAQSSPVPIPEDEMPRAPRPAMARAIPRPSFAAEPEPEPEREPEQRPGNPDFRPNRYVAPATGRINDDHHPFEDIDQ